ncbi:hypothetical protein [Amycolatopsis sp. CB00013]|uniref:hypothetical protein n=1 Tax=Amycolatopsis sp. CB00013 TaxID=1703945 RepID=UPI001160FF4F|nr:hypothetical protein [Amycolatopsis sp. CB00013]
MATKQDDDTLRRGLTNYLDTVESLRELAYFSESHAEHLDDLNSFIAKKLSGLVEISPETVKKARGIFDDYLGDVVKLLESTNNTSTDANSKEKRREFQEEVKRLTNDMGGKFKTVAGADIDGSFLMPLVVSALTNTYPRSNLLAASLLTMCVGSFEVLVGAIVRAFFRLRPDALKQDEPKITWSELQDYKTIDDFRDHYIERHATEIMRGGLKDWFAWLDKRLKVNLGDLCANPAALQEIFQRRHLLVHADGIVNKQYLNSVSDADPMPELGDKVVVSYEYLYDAIESLTAVGVLLTYKVRRRLTPPVEFEKDEHYFEKRISALLIGRQYPAVEKIAEVLVGQLCNDDVRLRLQVDLWTARRALYGAESIKSEVELWRVGSLSDKFILAKHVLLGEVTHAKELARKMLDSGEITYSWGAQWPLMGELLNDMRNEVLITDVSSLPE